MTIRSTLDAIIRIILLFFTKGKNGIHNSTFWHQKAVDLLEENRILKQQLQDQKQSRMIADKVFLESRAKLDDLKYELDLFEQVLDERREEIERREGLLCSCKRLPTKIPIFEFESSCSSFDNWEDDVPMDFKQEAFDCITQLLVSKANSATIYIALDDLCVKADGTNIECLKIILDGMLRYLKSQSLLSTPEAVSLIDVDSVTLLQNL